MGKYDPLAAYLKRKRLDVVELSFTDLERLIGGFLPKGALREDWWIDDGSAPRQPVQRQAWLGVGYGAVLLPNERVRFRRLTAPPA